MRYEQLGMVRMMFGLVSILVTLGIIAVMTKNTAEVSGVGDAVAGRGGGGSYSSVDSIVVREKINQGVIMITTARTGVQASYLTSGSMPADWQSAGMNSPGSYATDAIKSISYSKVDDSNATVTIAYKGIGEAVADGQSLVYRATAGAGGVSWTCRGTGSTLPAAHIPAACR